MFARSMGELSGDKDTIVEYSSCSCEGTSADMARVMQMTFDTNQR